MHILETMREYQNVSGHHVSMVERSGIFGRAYKLTNAASAKDQSTNLPILSGVRVLELGQLIQGPLQGSCFGCVTVFALLLLRDALK